MPGRPMRAPKRPAVGFARPQLPRRATPTPVFNRPANPVRVQARIVKREAAQNLAQQLFNRPRPVVRPPSPPARIMPRQPAPVQVIRPPVAPVVRPSAPRSAVPRPATPLPARPAAGAPRRPIPTAGAPRRPIPAVPPVPGRRGAGRGLPSAPVIPAASPRPLAVNTAFLAPEMSSMVYTLNSALTDLHNRSNFTDIQTTVTTLDANLQRALDLLEGARSQNYFYQNDLENIAYDALDKWETIRAQVQQAMLTQSRSFQGRLTPLSGMVSQINTQLRNPSVASSLVSQTQSQVNTLLGDLNQIHYSLEAQYNAIESAVNELITRLTHIHWALKQITSASFKLLEHEDMFMAVQARWDREGDDDPEGVLYLTNKRFIFEQKEEVATKKVLFLTLAKELVQRVIIDQLLAGVGEVKAVNKGLFGHQDFIQVSFSDSRLGNVGFHLNGQDCKQWTTWINSAKSGEIEKGRFTGSTLSAADLTGPLTTADLMAVQNEVNGLQEEVLMTVSRQELTSMENELRSLERKLAEVRARGYSIEKGLEADIAVLATQWERVKGNAEKTIETEIQLLSGGMKAVQAQLAQVMSFSANLEAGRSQFIQLKSAIASLDAQAEAAEAAVLAQYDEYADEVETLTAHLAWVGWMLDAIDTASFKLMATESGIGAVEALFARPGFEAENGVLFLTDQRILWEDRVEAFEVKVQAALSQIHEVSRDADEAGNQYLRLEFAPGVDYPAARFTLSMPVADDWLKMVGRARSGGYAQDRAVELDPAELERIRKAPQQCPNCGGALTAPILRGQTEITCEYCGVKTRI